MSVDGLRSMTMEHNLIKIVLKMPTVLNLSSNEARVKRSKWTIWFKIRQVWRYFALRIDLSFSWWLLFPKITYLCLWVMKLKFSYFVSIGIICLFITDIVLCLYMSFWQNFPTRQCKSFIIFDQSRSTKLPCTIFCTIYLLKR